jgi:hypothetical protein
MPHEWIIDELREAEPVSAWADAVAFLNMVKQPYCPR